jgi:hypothetical protein
MQGAANVVGDKIETTQANQTASQSDTVESNENHSSPQERTDEPKDEAAN